MLHIYSTRAEWDIPKGKASLGVSLGGEGVWERIDIDSFIT